MFFGKMMMMITPAEAARKHTAKEGDEGEKWVEGFEEKKETRVRERERLVMKCL